MFFCARSIASLYLDISGNVHATRKDFDLRRPGPSGQTPRAVQLDASGRPTGRPEPFSLSTRVRLPPKSALHPFPPGTFSPEFLCNQVGTLRDGEAAGSDAPESDVQADDKTRLYLSSDNTLYYPTFTDFKVNAFRAYFQLKNGLTAGEPSSTGGESNNVRTFNLNFGNEATGINSLKDLNASKDLWYSLDGRKLGGVPTAKGIYINNGKKVLVGDKR